MTKTTSDIEQYDISGFELVQLLQAVLEQGTPFRFQARGYSMSPFVKSGDIITVAPIADIPPRLGELIAFAHPETKNLVVHRMIGTQNGNYIMKGDNLSEADGLISLENILGRVVGIERAGKKLYFGLGLERILIVFLLTKPPLLSLLRRLRVDTLKLLGLSKR